MVLLKNYKLKAASLTESIVAMVIIALCLSIGILIYTNVLRSDRNLASIVAEQKVKELLLKTKINKEYLDESFSFEGFTIDKKLEKINESNFKIQFIVTTVSNKDKYTYIIAD